MAGVHAKALRIGVGLMMILWVGVLVPAQAAIEQKTGSVLVPFGSAGTPESVSFVNSDCEQDQPDGVLGAYFDMQGYSRVAVRVISAQVGAPALIARLWPTCDVPTYLAGGTYYDDCVAPCTLVVGTARYLELTIQNHSGLGANFRLDLTTA